ncbi:MAG: hypothetical protein M0R33_07505 [Methylomonas sp.]|jgi:hypothetical protein|uniref:hypothetical protein n=1 Tax=Methylomonas sp. TaxID=418 RepID=UPI0025F02028|nr:hypothetical protein [Methylomonas sp.]MCK9606282.1 hypothetical protein [Methylomonas sp.]
MDNDILINQARQLYADIQARHIEPSPRLEHLLNAAYQRYLRRLNRCVLCYQNRSYDCIREPGAKLIPCPQHNPSRHAA